MLRAIPLLSKPAPAAAAAHLRPLLTNLPPLLAAATWSLISWRCADLVAALPHARRLTVAAKLTASGAGHVRPYRG